jgi:hypothetical protein
MASFGVAVNFFWRAHEMIEQTNFGPIPCEGLMVFQMEWLMLTRSNHNAMISLLLQAYTHYKMHPWP